MSVVMPLDIQAPIVQACALFKCSKGHWIKNNKNYII